MGVIPPRHTSLPPTPGSSSNESQDIQQIDDVFLEEYEPRHYVLLEVGYKQTVAEDVPALATPGAIMARTEALTETIYYRYYFPTFGGLTTSGTLTKA